MSLRNLEIAQSCHCAISRLRSVAAQSSDCAAILRNLEIGTQFRDSENAQRNLEIAQIPKLRRTYVFVLGRKVSQVQNEVPKAREVLQIYHRIGRFYNYALIEQVDMRYKSQDPACKPSLY